MKRLLMLPLAVVSLAVASIALSAQDRTRVGLIPFDVANVDGGTQQAATAMAKLVRAQMISSKSVQPILIELPPGAKLPLPEDRLAALATENDVKIIVAGTILEASTTRGSNRISTGSIPGVGGVGGYGNVGGSMSKTKAEIQLHVEMVNNEGRTYDTFKVEGSNTDVGIGADVWTTLGNFDVGEQSWDKSPMGKALREAAQKLSTEVQKRRVR